MTPSPFDACARCGHSRANHPRSPVPGASGGAACHFTSCTCDGFVAPIPLTQLRELRRRLAGEVLDARRRALGLEDGGLPDARP